MKKGLAKDRELNKRIGAVLRKRREELEISQDAFADLIEMHRTYYGRLELGKLNITMRTLKRVSAGLRVKAWDVLREADV